MSALRIAALSLALSLAATSPAFASEPPVSPAAKEVTPLERRAADVVEVFADRMKPEEVFGPAFLAAIPTEQLKALNAQLEAQYGKLVAVVAVEPVQENFANVTYKFERAMASATLAIDPTASNLIAGLRLTGFKMLDDTEEQIHADLAALPGATSVWFGSLDGETVHFSSNPSPRLPLGSTHKLYTLSALTRQVAEGQKRWDSVVPLSVKSWPSGRLQTWTQGSPLTLQTLATFMISISDNTATDQLLKLLGRQTVEAELALAGHGNPELTIPFLSTLELFSLRADLELAERYAAADSKGKRTILAQLADQTRGSSDNATMPTNTVPTMIDKIEWFANTQDIRNLFKTIVGFEDPTVLSVMEVNKGISDSAAKDWAYVGYKGGSEPGVLNLSWLLRDEDGAYHSLVMSWTNTEAEVETSTFIALAERILALR